MSNSDKPNQSTILIVDDNEINIEILQEYLEDDYKVITATNGNEGIEIVRDGGVDLMLLDVMMPDINGYEVCEILKKEPAGKKVPIILVTAKAEVEDKVRGLEIGADDYIVKPFNFDELLARIKSHLRIYKLQEEVANAKVANELSKMKLDFLSIVSHELRTPLHSILGFTELLKSKKINNIEKSYKYLDEIHNGAIKLKELIENLLLYTQINTNMYQAEIKNINIYERLDSIKEFFSEKLQKKDIELKISVDKDTHLLISPEIFDQILFKIIDNAIKFSKIKNEILIESEIKEDFVIIKVSDYGIGISDELKKEIFKPFYQANSSYKTRSTEGLGLGLALVDKLIQYINGSITVEENTPNGSTFVISIPRKNNTKNNRDY